MPCDQIDHSHHWATSGPLSISECERICGFCRKNVGSHSAHRYSNVRELRKHVERHHISDLPELTIARRRTAHTPNDLQPSTARKPPQRESNCEALGHDHMWAQHGDLIIYSCERICQFCADGPGLSKRKAPFYDASTLRDHVRDIHMHDFPDLRLVSPNG